jgi:carbon-monoxide dehydrogenase medium subunit
VIPQGFEYEAPESLEEAIRLYGDGGEDVKLLAGGHSLIPLMKERLAAPEKLIDLRRVPGLVGIERENGGYRIGAMTPHRRLEFSPELGVLAEAAGTIADPQVRHRGTIGGSLAHADPASDLPAVLMAVEATYTAQGRNGQRQIAAGDLALDYLTTSLADDEVLIEVRVPALEGYGFGYEKFNRRAEDWAMVAVSVVMKVTDGTCEDVRVGLTHMSGLPLRATAVEEALRGQAVDADRIAAAAEHAAEGTEPPGDLNATPEYKSHLARVLTKRALSTAAGLV